MLCLYYLLFFLFNKIREQEGEGETGPSQKRVPREGGPSNVYTYEYM
jgi:hypothetical protein